MNPIVISEELSNRLQSLRSAVELCDPTERVVGEFVPRTDASEWEVDGPEMSDEELMARVHSGQRTYSTAEVLDHLRRLS